MTPAGAVRGPCPRCGMPLVQGEPDPCLGYLPGVVAACCGHARASCGDENWNSYVFFENGVVVRGFNIVEYAPLRDGQLGLYAEQRRQAGVAPVQRRGSKPTATLPKVHAPGAPRKSLLQREGATNMSQQAASPGSRPDYIRPGDVYIVTFVREGKTIMRAADDPYELRDAIDEVIGLREWPNDVSSAVIAFLTSADEYPSVDFTVDGTRYTIGLACGADRPEREHTGRRSEPWWREVTGQLARSRTVRRACEDLLRPEGSGHRHSGMAMTLPLAVKAVVEAGRSFAVYGTAVEGRIVGYYVTTRPDEVSPKVSAGDAQVDAIVAAFDAFNRAQARTRAYLCAGDNDRHAHSELVLAEGDALDKLAQAVRDVRVRP